MSKATKRWQDGGATVLLSMVLALALTVGYSWADPETVPKSDVPDYSKMLTDSLSDISRVGQVTSGGGGRGQSEDFVLTATIGQAVAGRGVNDTLRLVQGFWGGYSVSDCCRGIRGNVNGDEADVINILDVTELTNYMMKNGPAPTCLAEANVDGDDQGMINISDLTYLVKFLFDGGSAPMPCP